MTSAIAVLVFLFVVVLVVGGWWVSQVNRNLRSRLSRPAPVGSTQVLKPDIEKGDGAIEQFLARTGLPDRLASLAAQAGHKAAVSDLTLIVVACAAVGGAGGWLRTGGFFWGVLTGLISGFIPIVYLIYKRSRRLERFQTQFPDGLDMITRAIRAGNALSGAIRLVGQEMPDPVGQEFRQIDEEIRLGMDPGDALFRLQGRVGTEDVRFFCTAIRIQRGSGGNLAEILERLAEVIRERFKILSYARVLAAQHRWSAILVGLSPLIFGVMFQILHPGFFDPLFNDPIGPTLILGGVVMEVIGFFTIWRIAQIKV
jgi:tight adherence protein B